MFNFIKKLMGGASDEELKAKIKEGAFLVDVRTPVEFDAGKVKGSTNIPLDKIERSLSQFQNKSSIIVFCRSGNRSSQAKAILKRNGIQNVYNGGTWQAVNQLLHS